MHTLKKQVKQVVTLLNFFIFALNREVLKSSQPDQE